jgi:hypothetical protein
MSTAADLLLVLGLPLLFLVALTVLLTERGSRLPPPWARLASLRGRLWISYTLLLVAVLLGRLLLSRGR